MFRNSRKQFIGLMLIFVFTMMSFGVVHATSTPPPNIFSYQGRILDKNTGSPVTDASLPITFSLYSAASGGSPLWSETRTVTLTSGLFSENLGDNISFPISDSVFGTHSSVYLAININSDGEMTTRKLITAAPYALNAHSLNGLTTSDLGGTIALTSDLTDANFSFSDITTNNVSLTKHGFVPKLPGGTTTFLRADGTFAAPAGGGGGNALTSNPLSQFASTTSAQLAGVLSDETGTGLSVFNNTPTLTTPTINGATVASGNLTLNKDQVLKLGTTPGSQAQLSFDTSSIYSPSTGSNFTKLLLPIPTTHNLPMVVIGTPSVGSLFTSLNSLIAVSGNHIDNASQIFKDSSILLSSVTGAFNGMILTQEPCNDPVHDPLCKNPGTDGTFQLSTMQFEGGQPIDLMLNSDNNILIKANSHGSVKIIGSNFAVDSSGVVSASSITGNSNGHGGYLPFSISATNWGVTGDGVPSFGANTSGNTLVNDGTGYKSVALSGAITMNASGVTAFSGPVVLGTGTTGNYVSSIASDGSGTINVNGSGSVTLGIPNSSLDFTQIKPTLNLLASTTISGNTLSLNSYSGSDTNIHTGYAAGAVNIGNANSSSRVGILGGGIWSVDSTSGNFSTIGDINADTSVTTSTIKGWSSNAAISLYDATYGPISIGSENSFGGINIATSTDLLTDWTHSVSIAADNGTHYVVIGGGDARHGNDPTYGTNGADNISIATNGTRADTVNIGNITAGTVVGIRGGTNWSLVGETGNFSTVGNISTIGNMVLQNGTGMITTTGAGTLAIDSDLNGNINIGTSSVNSKTIIIGDPSHLTNINLDAGSGGITIGDTYVNSYTPREIDIGGVHADGSDIINIATNDTHPDSITIGTTNTSTSISGGQNWNIANTGSGTFSPFVPVSDVLSISSIGPGDTTTPNVDGMQIAFGANSTVTSSTNSVLHLIPSFAGAGSSLEYNVIGIDSFSATNGAGGANVNGISIGDVTGTGFPNINSTAIKIGATWRKAIDINNGKFSVDSLGSTTISGTLSLPGAGVVITSGPEATSMHLSVANAVVSGQAGGLILMSAGDGKITGNGGSAEMLAGNSGTLAGNGGNIAIFAGDSNASSSGDGGTVTIQAGSKGGAGSDGSIDIGMTHTKDITIGNTAMTGLTDGVKLYFKTITANQFAVCHVNDGAGVDIIGDCFAAPIADYAEKYPVAAGATFGDIVVPGTAMVTTKDGQHISQLIKSSAPYTGPVAGIISNNYGDFTSAGNNVNDSDNPMPVALVGRVPVNVTNENGAIAVGDYITTSSTAGFGMKATQAGRVIGMALEAFNGTSGQVMVQVNNSWYFGNLIGTDGKSSMFTDNVITAPIGTASSSTPTFDSFGLELRGSAWNGSAAQTVQMAMKEVVTDTNNYRLSVRNTTDSEVAYVTNTGTMQVSGDMVIGGKIYPSNNGVVQTSKYIYYDGAVGPAGDYMRTNAKGWSTGSYDFAEMFPASESLVPGEVVVFSDNKVEVRRSENTHEKVIAGIVSTRPGFLAGDNVANAYPIALAGRVPTNVNLENGAIAVGDPLTTSSQAGFAMKAKKAGMIVGYALEAFDGSSNNQISVFVNAGYWGGEAGSTTLGANNSASLLGSNGNSSVAALNMSGNVNMNGNDITSIGRIAGLADAWSIESDGTIKTTALLKTVIVGQNNQKVETIGVTSPEAVITLAGTSKLVDGKVDIKFSDVSPDFANVISSTAAIRVIATPNGPVSLYVSEKDSTHFTVQSFGSGNSDADFDWMVTAYRKGFEPVAPVPTQASSASNATSAPVSSVPSTSSTSSSAATAASGDATHSLDTTSTTTPSAVIVPPTAAVVATPSATVSAPAIVPVTTTTQAASGDTTHSLSDSSSPASTASSPAAPASSTSSSTTIVDPVASSSSGSSGTAVTP